MDLCTCYVTLPLDDALHIAVCLSVYLSVSLSIVMTDAVVMCEIKLFQNHFRGWLQLMNVLQHVQCHRNNFETISVVEIVSDVVTVILIFQLLVLVTVN